ncbi:MAG: hypothetical protein RJB30_9 [Actinomycetota bacterium]|jgi:fused signal recognition particle receptor
MGLFGSFFARFAKDRATPEDLDEFRKVLIESDLGAKFADEIVELVRREKSEELLVSVSRHLQDSLTKSSRELNLASDRLTTILMVGVNGTGKTTSSAKLAALLSGSGKRVCLAAADTFRAAAVEQLQTWGERIGAPVVVGKPGADPAAVAFDAAQQAVNEGFDILIIDTAGRLHTKDNLMAELTKVHRVVAKVTPVDEALFVLDGTNGQNGIAQARIFSEAIPVTGLVVTKLDGSTRGGIALAVERELQIPVKFVGTGEAIGDLRPFDASAYIAELLTQP